MRNWNTKNSHLHLIASHLEECVPEFKVLSDTLDCCGVFYDDMINSSPELAFKFAVHSINKNKRLLPDTKLQYNIQYVPRNNLFRTLNKVCSQIETGVYGIFDPSDGIIQAAIHSVCDALDIPHLESQPNVLIRRNEFSINIHPSLQDINMAFDDVISYFNWTDFGIIYEKPSALVNLGDVLQRPEVEMLLWEVENLAYTEALSEFKSNDVYNIIVDINMENILLLFNAILQLKMNEYRYHYLFTSFNIDTFELHDFKHNFVNMTFFRLVDVKDVGVRRILRDMEIFSKSNNKIKKDDLRKIRMIETESALMYDSVYTYAIGLQTLDSSHTLRLSNLSCENEVPWDGGLSLINYINSVEWKGLTGPIQFKEGQRTQFKLDLLKLRQNSIVKIGEWSPKARLNITDRAKIFAVESMNVTLLAITILETPYVMMHHGKNFTGNDRFYGFCVDILDLIARKIGFDYILDLVPDRKYGAKDPVTGKWNGMVAELMKYKADLAVGSITINYARESVIDFTKPFMNLGISILFKVTSTPSARMFSFMNPLAVNVWLYVLAAYFLVSVTMYIVAWLSPYERNANVESERSGNRFTLRNCFWFTIGTLMQQSSDLYPRAASTRIVSGIWWFFTLIMISSYTANLAAFLTVERMATPIENAEDLASQTDIAYGTLESGSTMTFFRDSMIETYRKMWRYMEGKKPTVFTSTYEEGINRVLEGNYAFLMESTMLDYIVQRDCNLTQIGGLLGAKGYGIATPKGSPWRDKISLAILELQEKGDIQILYDKWWKTAGKTCIRKDKKKQSKASSLDLDSIGGIFVILICGLLVALGVSLYEFRQFYKQRIMENSSRAPDNLQGGLCKEIICDFCFALRCLGLRQQPTFKRQCSKCSSPVLYLGTTELEEDEEVVTTFDQML